MPPVKFAFNLAQFALVTAVLILVVHFAAAADPGFGWLTWGAVLAGDPDRRRADDRADPRRDRADRGPRLARPGAPDVRHGPRGHDHRHGDGARLRRSSGSSGPRPTPLLLVPILDRLRRLPRLRPRARGPREGQVPLRGQPHAVRVARGRRRARGPARAGARGLPRRAGRGHPVRRRRRRAAAHQPRPGHRPRGDGAGRRRRGRRAAHAAPTGSDAAVALLAPFPATLDPYLAAARRPPRHARRAARRGPRDRHDHAREPLRPLARLHRRRPRAVRDAGRQRERRAAVRPPRAGRLRAARPAGPAPAPGPPRPAHRARQPLAVQPAGARGARAGHARARSP